MTIDPATMAERVREAGVPDVLNRWIGMTPADLVAYQAKLKRLGSAMAREPAPGLQAIKPRTYTKAVVLSPETALAQEADRRWRHWSPPATGRVTPADLKRPRKATILRRLREELAQQTPATRPGKTTPATVKPTSKPTAQPGQQETTMAKKASKTANRKARRKAASKKASKPKADGDKTPKAREPRGKTIEVLKLAARDKGVSRAELDELTGWKGTPWKWYFSNPKNTGCCDRFGYEFEVVEGDKGETRYKVTKRPA